MKLALDKGMRLEKTREQTTLRLPSELKEKLQNERGNGLECLSY